MEIVMKNKSTLVCKGLSELLKYACMTMSGETAKIKMEVLRAKCRTRIGLWNVCTLYEIGKQVQITAKIMCHNLHRVEKEFRKGGQSTPQGSRHHPEERDREVPDVIETCQQQTDPHQTVFHCYSLTNDNDNKVKLAFNEQLQTDVNAAPQ